jgi:uncharacterized membrane protein HdeD (DUF308 family)
MFAFFWPGITLTALVFIFAAYAITDGIFSIAAVINATQKESKWWALLLEGILGISAGLLTILVPGITALVLLYTIAIWAILTGVLELVTAIRLRREIEGEWLMAFSGIASMVFGVILFLFPGAGALAVVWWIGAYALIFGVLLLALAIRLRSGTAIPVT